MKSLVYIDYQKIEWKEVEKPEIKKENEAIIKIEAFTFSHADYRPYATKNSDVSKNLIMGHEGIGIIESIGKNIKNFQVGDRVIINSIIRCNECLNCQNKNYGNCLKAGFILGTKINGTHSEYVKIPYADFNLTKINKNIKVEEAVMLSDVMSTAYDNVISKIDALNIKNAAIIGDGPISMACFLLLNMYGIAVDIYGHHDNKLQIYLDKGAKKVYNNIYDNKKTYDLLVETVGNDRGTFEFSQQLVNSGGTIITIGVFQKPVSLYLNNLWYKNITIKTGILTNNNVQQLLSLLQETKIDLTPLISKVYDKNNVINAFQEFTNKANFKIVVKL